MSNSKTTSQPLDRRTIKEFLMHAAGEVRLQELTLDGKPVPPRLQQGVSQFRAKYGSELLPDAGLLNFLANDPLGDEDAQRDAARQALVTRRREQLRQLMGVIELLGELEM